MKQLKISGEDLFFTSDLHIGHDNIINFCNRPYESIEQMNQGIIEEWNNVVPVNGNVFLLGDVSWKGAQYAKKIISQLNGNITLIRGNHDPDTICNLFSEVYDMLALDVQDEDSKMLVHLCHYPLTEWLRSQKGSIHLHGHCHGSRDELDLKNWQILDVGVDSHLMKPISWDKIKTILNKKYLKQ